MKKFIIGFIAGVLLTGTVGFAATALDADVSSRIQTEMGSLMTTVMSLQAQLAAAQVNQGACEQKLKEHHIK
jgi:hypothetical protein